VTQVHSRTSAPGRSVAECVADRRIPDQLTASGPIVGLVPRGFGFDFIDVGVARSHSDVAAANALLVDRYAPMGYAIDKAWEAGGVPDANVLIAKNRLDGSALATLTLRIDGESGLMAEHMYPAEVAELRDDGRRLCEVVRFASTASFRSIDLLRRLFDAAFSLGQQLDRSDVLIEVTPRHAAFYKRILGFRAVGSPRHNPRVNTTGTLMHAKLSELAARVGRVSLQGLVAVAAVDDISETAPAIGSSRTSEAAILP